MKNPFDFKLIEPEKSLSDFIYCFSSLQNFENRIDAVIIPNGKIDLVFSKMPNNQLFVSLLGLETKPKLVKQAITNFFSVSFNPLAIHFVEKRIIQN